jgi:hypothetical protein
MTPEELEQATAESRAIISGYRIIQPNEAIQRGRSPDA